MTRTEDARRTVLRGLPLRVVIPNAVTSLALCSGLTGVRLAIGGHWEKAVLAVVLAGVLDALDGRLARLLKGTSRFGAELDSLSDVIAFGVSPAIIMYLWALHDIPGVGWIVALSLAVCCALRLARFNATLEFEDLPHKRLGFLTGVPSPTGAGLALSPIFLSYWLETDLFRNPYFAGLVVAATAFLMVSSVPTFSWRSLRLRRDYRLPLLVAVGLLAGGLLSAPWGTLSMISLAYVASIGLSIRSYRRSLAGHRPPGSDMQPEPASPGAGPASPDTAATASLAAEMPGADDANSPPAASDASAGIRPDPAGRSDPSLP